MRGMRAVGWASGASTPFGEPSDAAHCKLACKRPASTSDPPALQPHLELAPVPHARLAAQYVSLSAKSEQQSLPAATPVDVGKHLLRLEHQA